MFLVSYSLQVLDFTCLMWVSKPQSQAGRRYP
jgi:hypothetical protein